MNTSRNIEHLIERATEGSLTDDERAQLEQAAISDDALQAHVASVQELRALLNTRFDDVANDISFAQIQSNVLAAVDTEKSASTAHQRTQYMDMQAMAWADGELHDPEEHQAALSYLQQHPEAASAANGLRDLREFTRLPFERAREDVDFDAMSEQVMARIDEQTATTSSPVHHEPSSSSFFDSIIDRFRSAGPLAAAFAGAAIAIIALLPLLLQQNNSANKQPNIVNHYYMGNSDVESVQYDKGYWGTITPGDDMNAPVIWIQQEKPTSHPPTETDTRDATPAPAQPTGTERGI